MNTTNEVTNTEVIILAGGFGTRLQSEVAHLPKPMAPIAGRPFLTYLLDSLANQGTRHVIITVHHMAAKIMALGSHYKGMAITYSIEKTPLGTGGAIIQALKKIKGKNALVINGDTYLDLDLRSILRNFKESESGMMIAVTKVAHCNRYSTIRINSKKEIIGFDLPNEEKSEGLINAGVYVISKKIFNGFHFPASFSFEVDFLSPYIKKIRVLAYQCDGYFVDIGVPDDYRLADRQIPNVVSARAISPQLFQQDFGRVVCC